MENKLLYHKYQSGKLKNNSTTILLLNFTLSLFVDFTNAFDIIDFDILYAKVTQATFF